MRLPRLLGWILWKIGIAIKVIDAIHCCELTLDTRRRLADEGIIVYYIFEDNSVRFSKPLPQNFKLSTYYNIKKWHYETK